MHRRSRSNRTKDINSYYGDCASLVYSFIPNRRGSPFINFRPICHYPRSLFHNPLILIFGRIATTPVYYINPVNLSCKCLLVNNENSVHYVYLPSIFIYLFTLLVMFNVVACSQYKCIINNSRINSLNMALKCLCWSYIFMVKK